MLSDKVSVPFRALIEGGTLIVGGLGAGKSSTSLRQAFMGLLYAGVGALVSTTKSTDTADCIAMARACGFEKNVLVFSIESGMTFDPLAFLWSTGRGAGVVENIVDFFDVILSIGKPLAGSSADRFWELASQQTFRATLVLLWLAGVIPSITNIYRAIQSFPMRPGEHDEESWEKSSYTASLIDQIRERKNTLSQPQWTDLENATRFVFDIWPSMDERTRSNIAMTVYGLADKFTYSPFREMFCSGRYDFTPWQITHEHKIVILDIPVLSVGRETARLMQTIVKLVCQRDWLSHPYRPGCCNGAALVQDEFQMLMSRFENHFVQVCRGSAIAPIYITQTILNLAEEMGESQPGSKTKAFLNNLSVKIAHNLTCPDTATYFADVIGKSYRYIDSFNAGSSGESHHTHTSVGGARQLAYHVEPIEFTRLLKPDATNPLSEAIVWQSGRTFTNTTKREPDARSNYLRVLFSRE